MKHWNFTCTSSEHYDFHYLKSSPAERDLHGIIAMQEKCYMEITKKLMINPGIRIQYYLMETPEMVGEIYGDREPCNGFASPPDKIYAVYNDEIKCIGYHEDAHILSYTMNRPQSNFIREGLAMYFDKRWWNHTNEEWVLSFLKEKKYIPVNQLLQNQFFLSNPESVTYPIAGAFTKFLIDHYGMMNYLTLYQYKGIEFAGMFHEVYQRSVEKLEEEFIRCLLQNESGKDDQDV